MALGIPAVTAREPSHERMGPFWEMTWKMIWLLRVALPLWRSGQMDQSTADNVFACLMVIVVAVAVPWRYVFERYAETRGDPWRVGVSPSVSAETDAIAYEVTSDQARCRLADSP